jgi:hypothetical protein
MSNEKEMSAVEWLIENLNHLEMKKSLYKPIDFRIKKQRIIDQAKEKEKGQHANTWDDSRVEDKGDNYIGKQKSFNEYYEQTYGGNK